MRLIPKQWLALVAVALLPCALVAASFTASLDRDSMTLGEQATLQLKFDEVQPKDAPGLPNIPGLQIQYVGPSSAFSFVNGQTSSSITYSYVVTAQHDGEFTIPGMRANIGGQQLTSQPLKLIVTKAAAPSADAVNSGKEPAFMKLTFPKKKIYVGEPLVGRLEIYVREDVQNFGNFQLTSSPTDGFTAGKIAELANQRRRMQVGNRAYTVISLAVPLTPVRTGPLTLGPFTGSIVVVLPSPNQNADPFFGRFLNQGEQRQITLATEAIDVESQALPLENKPGNFTGAVGSFDMTATAGPTAVTVGDPITVRVQISGRGAFDTVTLPLQDAWRDFKTYPPKVDFKPSDKFGIVGAKSFEQVISPESADIREIPGFVFSYFNPDKKTYETLNQPPIPLTVKAGASAAAPSVVTSRQSQGENTPPPAQDIVPIKDHIGAVTQATVPLVEKPWFMAFQCVPVIGFIGALAWRRRNESLASNPRLRRQRMVAQIVQEGLGTLRRLAAENRSDDFFATLFRLLQEQLGERLDVPASAITEAVIEENLRPRGVSDSVLQPLHDLFQTCNLARYAPIKSSQELAALVPKTEQVLKDLREKKL